MTKLVRKRCFLNGLKFVSERKCVLVIKMNNTTWLAERGQACYRKKKNGLTGYTATDKAYNSYTTPRDTVLWTQPIVKLFKFTRT